MAEWAKTPGTFGTRPTAGGGVVVKYHLKKCNKNLDNLQITAQGCVVQLQLHTLDTHLETKERVAEKHLQGVPRAGSA